uniref:Uncharacterized protein n=2 Tax=Rhizobium/Agrobacterium group TaxID=227290 RepID=A0A2Z2PZW4_AGRTU|nr:hypothetical protein [Agrobacterium radiobacter]QCL10729.1 hypothetical protein pOC-C5.8_553 [Rhizobium rhizogenes]
MQQTPQLTGRYSIGSHRLMAQRHVCQANVADVLRPSLAHDPRSVASKTLVIKSVRFSWASVR